MNYTELTKLYPEFKIPFAKYADYYLDVLLRANVVTDRPISLFQNFDQSVVSVSKYKMQKMDEILEYFKESGWNLSEINPFQTTTAYTNLDFNNWKEGYYYVSVDLREANWQSFKKAFNLQAPHWKEWTEDVFKLKPLISESKSFRQFVFGNTNPKRLQKIQEGMMYEILQKLTQYHPNLVSRKSDELIFEFDKATTPIIDVESFETGLYETRTTVFDMTLVESAGESIRVKTIHPPHLGKKKMINVPGTRYFIHLKNVILQEEIDEKDLYFENNGFLAKWII